MSRLDVKQTERYYDEIWQYDFDPADGHRQERRRIVRAYLGRLGDGQRILDVGCGNGLEAETLGAFGELWGVDLSPEAIRQAKSRYPQGKFTAGDCYTTELGEHTFDVVTVIEVIEHVPDQRGLLRRCHELLRPGGHLVLTVPNRYVMERWYGRARRYSDELLLMPEMHRRGYLQPIESWLTPVELRELLSECFDVVDMTTVCFGVGHRDWLRLANSRKLQAVVRALGMGNVWDRWRGKLGWGLHVAVLARAKPGIAPVHSADATGWRAKGEPAVSMV